MSFAPQPHALLCHLDFQKCSWAFCDLDSHMCLAPQPRALFRHLSFQECSAVLNLCVLALQMCLTPQPYANFAQRFRHRSLLSLPSFQPSPSTKLSKHGMKMRFLPLRKVHLSFSLALPLFSDISSSLPAATFHNSEARLPNFPGILTPSHEIGIVCYLHGCHG